MVWAFYFPSFSFPNFFPLSFSLVYYLVVVNASNLEYLLKLRMEVVFRLMGAAALQKYIGSLGGIGTSGVGSSSSYSPKELNKEIVPEKVEIFTALCYLEESYHIKCNQMAQ